MTTNDSGPELHDGTPGATRFERVEHPMPRDMTLRDHIAVEAMKAMLANPKIVGISDDDYYMPSDAADMKTLSMWSYEIARALLEAREDVEIREEVAA